MVYITSTQILSIFKDFPFLKHPGYFCTPSHAEFEKLSLSLLSQVLRCQFQGGQRKVVDGLTKSSSAAQLQEKLFILTGVAPHRQRS